MSDHPVPVGRALVIVPTYNEVHSLEGIVVGILDAPVAALDVLVVDDGSPDGTGALADRLAAASGRVSVLHRTSKDGLGRAYLAGFAWGLQRGYEVLVEMDADGSHPVAKLPDLVEAARDGIDMTVGSRWIPGGAVSDWSEARQRLSRGGNRYARAMLGIPVRDATSGFRAYRADLLGRLPLADVHSRGYCFQIDMTVRALDAGATHAEVPIEFRERRDGESKMSRAIVVEAMARVTLWGVQRFVRRLRGRGPRPADRASDPVV